MSSGTAQRGASTGPPLSPPFARFPAQRRARQPGARPRPRPSCPPASPSRRPPLHGQMWVAIACLLTLGGPAAAAAQAPDWVVDKISREVLGASCLTDDAAASTL